MTSADAELWDRFADDVLPWIGLPQLPTQLRQTCPELPAERIQYWVGTFNSANVDLDDAAETYGVEWTQEEVDGLWYDRMKSVALNCIDEATRIHGG